MNTKTHKNPPTAIGIKLSEAMKRTDEPAVTAGQAAATQVVQDVAAQAAQVAVRTEEDEETFSVADSLQAKGPSESDSEDLLLSGDDAEDDTQGINLDEEEEDGDDAGIVEVFKSKCLNCQALVPFAEKNYKSCHFSRGNEYCPASSLRIQIRLPVDEIVAKFLRAESSGDNARLARLHLKLASKSAYVQNRVNTALAIARNKRNA